MQIEQITKSKYDENLISNEYSPELKSLIASMLAKNSSARPTINEVLKSVFRIYRKRNWIPILGKVEGESFRGCEEQRVAFEEVGRKEERRQGGVRRTVLRQQKRRQR